MSTVKATHFEHPSASTPGITLASDGSVVLPAGFTGGVGSNVVSTAKTNAFSSAASGFNDVTGLSVSITPTSASSKILVIAAVSASASQANTLQIGVDRGGSFIVESTAGTVNGAAMLRINTSDDVGMMTSVFLDSPATTSSITYQVQIRRGSGGTVYVNRDGDTGFYAAVSTLTAIEVAA